MKPSKAVAFSHGNGHDGVTSTVAGARQSLPALRQNGEVTLAEEEGTYPITAEELELLEHWCGGL